MPQKCYICDTNTIFYVWSTSRNFPHNKLIKKKQIIDKRTIQSIKNQGFPICFRCFEELKSK